MSKTAYFFFNESTAMPPSCRGVCAIDGVPICPFAKIVRQGDDLFVECTLINNNCGLHP